MWTKRALLLALVLLAVWKSEGAPDTGTNSAGGHYRPNPNHDSGMTFHLI